jgi:uncharacterized Zn finger protein (UPF0148 family)
MSIDDLIEKGLIKTCNKHGAELVYFDASQECPICKIVIQSKPLNKKKAILQSKQSVPEPEKPKAVDERNLMEKARDWWNNKHNMKQKIFLFIVIVFLLWTYMNCQNIMSYIK